MIATILLNFPFPEIDASLNGASALILIAGYICIKRRKIRAHRALMITAIVVSSIFLLFYVTNHIVHQTVTRFPEHNPWHGLYICILLSHTILATATVPLVIITFLRAQRQQWHRHRKIAVWTFPIWLYVSITGVIVYAMLAGSGAYARARMESNPLLKDGPARPMIHP